MRCAQAKDILLTDYLDGSLDQTKSAELEQHIRGCGTCRALQKQAVAMQASLKETKLVFPPESVWRNIRTRLEDARVPWWKRIFQKFSIPQPVWAFSYATATAVIIIAIVFSTKFVEQVPLTLSDEAKLFAGLTEENVGTIDDFGTALEEYFL